MATLLYMKSPNDRKQLLVNVDRFLRDRFIYLDEKIETLLYPDFMLLGYNTTGYFVGDCDDITTLHAALLAALDFKVRFVAIRSLPPVYDHTYLEAFENNKWIMYDVTLPLGTVVDYSAGRFTIQV